MKKCINERGVLSTPTIAPPLKEYAVRVLSKFDGFKGSLKKKEGLIISNLTKGCFVVGLGFWVDGSVEKGTIVKIGNLSDASFYGDCLLGEDGESDVTSGKCEGIHSYVTEGNEDLILTFNKGFKGSIRTRVDYV